MKTLSIVIPVYYNADSLPLLFSRLQGVETALKEMEVGVQLIFVDDGSGDDSIRELHRIRTARPGTIIVKLVRNFGVDPATKCGLRFVTGDCFVVLAADLQDPPEMVVEMARRWLGGAKFVICERKGRSDPLLSMFFSALYYRLLRLLAFPMFPKGGFDLALFDKIFLPHMRDAAKGSSTTLTAYWLGYAPEVIHYRRERRRHGVSRWTFRKKVTAFFDDVLGFSSRPLRIVSLFGLLVAAVAFAYGMSVVVDALLGRMEVPGFASIVSLIAFLSGLIIAMLGLIGEYLARILNQINHRPEAVIEIVFSDAGS
jgi:dolichol-phosphate mannosyltransferase